MVNLLNIVMACWIGFWGFVITVLYTIITTLEDKDLEQELKESTYSDQFKSFVFYSIKSTYLLQQKIFGDKLISFRSLFASFGCSLLIFALCLYFAYVTTFASAESTRNPVEDFIQTLDMHKLALMDLSTAGFLYADFSIKLYTMTMLSILAAFVFEFLSLTKSRFFLNQIWRTESFYKVGLFLLTDIITTIVGFTLFYPLAYALLHFAMSLMFSGMPMLSIRFQESLERDPHAIYQNNMYEQWDIFVNLYGDFFYRILHAIKFEIKSGLSAFIVFSDDVTVGVISSSMTDELNKFGGVVAFMKLYPSFPLRFFEKDFTYPSMEFPFSLLMSSALFTTIWTVALSMAVFLLRYISVVSETWKSLEIYFNKHPGSIRTMLLTPAMAIAILGIIPMVTVYLSSR